MLSAVVLTKDEEENLPRCLSSLAFCDEVIVVDDISSDRTVNLAKHSGAIVYERYLNGDFAAQHNFGLEKAKGDWVLFLDADEVVPQKLAVEIKKAIRAKIPDGYYLTRQDVFLGQNLRFGETASLKFLRLGRKGRGNWHRRVHESWDITGPVGQLHTFLLHYSHPSIYQFIENVNSFTDLDARQLPTDGKDFNYWRVILNPSGKFLQNYILRLGFLDGLSGFVMAFMMSLNSLIVRVKMYETR